MKRVILATLAVAAMVSCTKQESFEGATSAAQEMKFTSGIESRVDGNEWELGDKIGIVCIDDSAMEVWAANIAYKADNGGSSTSFSVVDSDPIYFPSSSTFSLTVMVYYPYNEDLKESEYTTFDISDQSDLSAVDYMMDSATVTQDDTDNPIAFTFEHKHTLVKFTITALESIESLEGMTFQIENVQTVGVPGLLVDSSSDYYSLAEFGTIDSAVIDVADDGKSATIEMILFPTAITTYSTLRMNFEGKDYIGTLITSFEAGKQQNYTLAMGNNSLDFTGSTIEEWGGNKDEETELPSTLYACELTAEEFMSLTPSTIPAVANEWCISGQITFSAEEFGSMLSGIDSALGDREIELSFTETTDIGFMASYVDSGGITYTTRFIDNIKEVEALEATSELQASHFHFCSSLETIVLYKVPKINSHAFSNCCNLTALYLPSVTEIDGSSCFALDSNLQMLFFASPDPITIGSNVFNSFTSHSENCSLYLHYKNSDMVSDQNSWGGTTWMVIYFVDDNGEFVDASGNAFE
ncbi:MAG: fimbrillin family protein [Rikenellaceae bacterium]